MLNQLLDDHRPLLEKCAESVPDRIELSALAAMLHGLYTGVENILKRVVIELDEGLPSGQRWHRALLDRMTRPGPDRPPVISDALAESLTEYLAFRHFFRSAYPFVLQWERLEELVRGCADTLGRLEDELDEFLRATGGRQ